MIADVFGAEVVRIPSTNSAALGAALRALHGDTIAAGRKLPWDQVVSGFTDANLRVRPNLATTDTYARLLTEYQRFESEIAQARV